jgi:hypothetical protein
MGVKPESFKNFKAARLSYLLTNRQMFTDFDKARRSLQIL